MLLVTMLFLGFIAICTTYPVVKNSTTGAEEIQNAICKISTKEIEATANATVSRQLKGVCTSDEFHSRIDKLEKLLDEIVQLLKSENESFDEKIDENFQTVATLEKFSLHNDTIIKTDKNNVYVYYWKIENITEMLLKSELYKSSPNFEVMGHSLQLRFYPNYPIIYHFTLQLKPLSKSFVKKHQIKILNQKYQNMDLDSGILSTIKNDEDIMFESTYDNLKIDGFTIKNSILCLIKIYLDS